MAYSSPTRMDSPTRKYTAVGTSPSTLDTAIGGTKKLLDSLGIPRFGDMFSGGVKDFGPGFQGLPELNRPSRADFQPTGRPTALAAQGDLNSARKGYEDPTHTAAFQNLMSLASTRTASSNEAARDEDRTAAMRRGYVGGSAGNEQMRSRERMKALAAQGFEGAEKVREQELARYTPALEALTSQQTAREQATAAGARDYGASVNEFNKAQLERSRIPAEYMKTFGDLTSGGLGGLGGLFGSMVGAANDDINRPRGPFRVDPKTGQRTYLLGRPD